MQQLLFPELRQAERLPRASSKRGDLKLDEVKTQWEAFQYLRRDLESLLDRLGDVMISVRQIRTVFGITPAAVRRAAARGKVRKSGRRRKRYHVRDVLLAVLRSGAGRIRRPRYDGNGATKGDTLEGAGSV